MENPGESRTVRLALVACLLLIVGAIVASVAVADSTEGTPPPEETTEAPVEVIKPPAEESPPTPPPKEEPATTEPPPANGGGEPTVPPVSKEVETVVRPLPEAVGIKPQDPGVEAKSGDEAPSGGPATTAPSADGVSAAAAEGTAAGSPVVTHHHTSRTHGAAGARHQSASPQDPGPGRSDPSRRAPSADRGPGPTATPSPAAVARPESVQFLSRWVGDRVLPPIAKDTRAHHQPSASAPPPKTGLESAQAVERPQGGIGSFFSAITSAVRHALPHDGAPLPIVFFYAALLIGIVALVAAVSQGVGAFDGLSHRLRRSRSE